MGYSKKPGKGAKKPKMKRKRGLDAEDRALKLESKALKKQRKLERSMQIQEARKRREAIKAAGTVKMEDVIRAIGTPSACCESSNRVVPDVSVLLSSIGVTKNAQDFAWSTGSEASEHSDTNSEESEVDSVEEGQEEDESEGESAGESVEEEMVAQDEQLHERISFPDLSLTEESQSLLTSLMSGKDVIFASEKFHDFEIARSCYLMLSAYALSHILKKAQVVDRNNRRLKKKPHLLLGERGDEFRDQGPNRPRIYVLAPFRANAYEIIRNWLSLLNMDPEQVSNYDKFDEEYKDQHVRNEHAKNWEPWRRELFKGHYDDPNYDDFVLGISFNFGGRKMRIQFPKTAQALCAVDVIIASPLALSRISASDHKAIRLATSASIEKNGQQEDEIPMVMDFLSGIELLIVDRFDALAMQNSENCRDLLNAVNSPAVATISADINRIEEKFFSSETARAARQTVIISGSITLNSSDLNLNLRSDPILVESARSGSSLNRALKQKIKQQFFIRVPLSVTLLEYFKENFWKEVGNEIKHLVIVVANTQDWTPLQEFFTDEGIVDCFLSDIALSDIAGKRRKQIKHILRAFREGDIRTIVVSERLLWYQRIRITGAKHALFLGCPTTDSIYADILADMVDPLRCTSTCLFTANDKAAIERVVGTANLNKLISDEPPSEMPGKTTVFTPS